MLSAIKQSLKFHLPTLNEAIPFNEFIKVDFDGAKYIAHCENLEKETLKKERTIDKIVVLIGPEGDFTPEEIKNALLNDFKAVNLGTSRLRTETAGIVAVHTINIKS